MTSQLKLILHYLSGALTFDTYTRGVSESTNAMEYRASYGPHGKRTSAVIHDSPWTENEFFAFNN